LFAALRIPLGEGLSGWVAQNRKPMLNGNPALEHGYVHDPNRFSPLRSAISVPLEGLQGVVGVLTLYHSEPDTYTSDHLRILLAIQLQGRVISRKRPLPSRKQKVQRQRTI